MKRNFKLLVAVLVLVVMVFTLASCDMIQGVIDKIVPGEHEHEYSAEWSSDETNHWHAAICEDSEECASATADLATHTYVEGVCSVCNYEDPNYVPPKTECTEHAYSIEVTKEATCTEAGEKTLTCTVCGHSETQEIAPNGHTEETLEGKAPTCTEAGLSSGKKCSVCQEITKAQIEIGATGHSFVEGICACGEIDPDYNGPKTYVFDTNTVVLNNEDGTQNLTDKAEIPAGTTYVNGYFTITGVVTQRVKNSEYVYCVEVGKQDKGGIQFTVTGTATVSILFHSTSSSNSSWIGLRDAEGNLIANNEGVNTVTGTGEGLTVTYNLTAGTYTVVSPALTNEEGSDPYNRTARVYNITVTETPAEEEPAKEIKVETTDTYSWIDEYTFTADAEGYYTFTLPAGLGFWSVEAYNANKAPEIDYNLESNGGDVVLGLEAGETVSFYVGAYTKDSWVITWSFVEGDVEDDEAGDDPVASVKDANGLGGEYTFTFVMEYTLTFVPDSEGATTGTLIVEDPINTQYSGTYAYTIVDGGYVFATDANAIITQDMGGNWYFQNSGMMTAQQFAEGTVSGGSDDSGSSNIVVGSNSVIFTEDEIAADTADRTFVSTASGNYTIACSDLFFSVKDADGNAIAKTDGAYALGEGEYTISFGMFSMLSTQANTSYTLTVSVVEVQEEEEPDGTISNPYVWETIPESVTIESDTYNKVYYVFTSTVDGAIFFTWPTDNTDSWFDIYELTESGETTSNELSGYSKNSHCFVIESGKTYRVGLGTWWNAGTYEITINVAACEHSWSNATCETYSTCANCGATTGDLAEHTPGAEATCSAPQTCTVCGAELATANHSWVAGETVAADCAAGTNGTQAYTCSSCGATKEETIWWSHSWVTDELVNETCTTDGYMKKHCSVCEKIVEETYDATGHYSYSLSCGESGECWGCGETFTKDHNTAWSPATCTNAAFCYNCYSYVGEPLAHDYDETGLCTICYEATRTLVVAGSGSFFGSDWSLEDTNNVLAYADGVFTKTYVSTMEGIFQFKVIDVTDAYNWNVQINTENYYFYVNEGYTVVITVDLKTGTLTCDVYAVGSETATDGTTYMVTGDSGLCNDKNSEDGGSWGWELDNYDNLLTLNADGKYELVYTGVAAGTYGIKVVKNGNWNGAWGNADGGNYSITVDSDDSIVTITFDPENGISHTVHAHAWSDATCNDPQKCECGATQGEALGHSYVDGICSGCSAEDPDHYFVLSITDALAADDGKKVQVSGTVCAINTAWSDSYGNISVTITDADGNTLYIFRLKTNVALGDIITVQGAMGTYNGRQIAAGATATIDGHDDSYDYVEMTVEEAIAAADDTNVIVTGTVVEINTAYNSSYNNISVTISDDNGTQLYLYRLTGEVTVGQIIKVKGTMDTYSGARQITGGTYEAVGTHTCSNYTEATCTVAPFCIVCGAVNGTALGHSYVDGTCSVCGDTESTTPVVNYVLKATASDGTAYYWDGTVSSGKGGITTDSSAAVVLNMETVDGGVYVYYTEESGAKQYITIGTSNTSFKLSTTATAISYDADNGYLYSGERYVSTYGTQDIRTYKASNIPGSNTNLYMVLTVVD